MRICLVDDDLEYANLVKLWLEDAGYECVVFRTGQQFKAYAGRESFHLVSLDWNLPDCSGPELLSWVRQCIDWPVPVIFNSARSDEEDVVGALDAGADDYFIKPISRAQLLARINAVARRAIISSRGEKGVLDYGEYQIDNDRQQLFFRGELIRLTSREFALALFLFHNHGRTLSRGHILREVWSQNYPIKTRTVDTHVSRLRNKLNLDNTTGWSLESIYQRGYRLKRLGGSLANEDNIAEAS